MNDLLLELQVAGSLFPLILNTIHQLEDTKLSGPDKLHILIETVKASLKLLPASLQSKIPIDGISAFAEMVTNTIIAMYNLRGIFSSGNNNSDSDNSSDNNSTPVITTAQRIEEIKTEIASRENHLAHMSGRLSAFQSLPNPDQKTAGQILNLTRNIADEGKVIDGLKKQLADLVSKAGN